MSPAPLRPVVRRWGSTTALVLVACAGLPADRHVAPAAQPLQGALRLSDFVRGSKLAGFGWAPFRMPTRAELEAAAAAGHLEWQIDRRVVNARSLGGGDVGVVRVHFDEADAEAAAWPDAGNVFALSVRPAPTPGGDGAAQLATLGVRTEELLAVYRYGPVLLWRTNVSGLLVTTPATEGLLREALEPAPFELWRPQAIESFLDNESLTPWTTLQDLAATGQLSGLLNHADGLTAARQHGLAARVDALLHAGLAAEGPRDEAWRQLGAAWRLAVRFGVEAGSFVEPWRAGLQRRAAALTAELRTIARDAAGRGITIEAAWLEGLADEVDQLAARPSVRTERGEEAADVLDVLGAAAQQVASAVAQGGFRPEQPPELERTVGLTQTQVDTAAFRSWSGQFAARRQVLTAALVAQREAEQRRLAEQREAEQQRLAAQREAEQQRAAAQRAAAAAAVEALASRGLLASAAEKWAEHADQSAAARSLLGLWGTSERQVGATALLQLLAKLLPFVPATDPDAGRLYAALRQRLERTPLASRHRLALGSDMEAATFGALAGAEPVVPLLHALEDQLRSDVRADHQAVAEEREVLVPNPALEQWRDQVARRQGDVELVDQAFRSKVGIAPSDPGFDTWMRLNPNAHDRVEPLLELRRQAVASAWYAGSARPPEQVAARIRSERLVKTVRQDWTGFAARTLGLLGGGVFVTDRVEHTIRSTGHVLDAKSEFSAMLASGRVENEVARAALAELDRRTTAALPTLVQKFLVARAGHYLAAGRRSGWTETEFAAEAQALARLLDLPAGTPEEWLAAASPPPDLAAALATQTALGGGLRQVSTCVPVLPPLERLKMLCEFTGAWTQTDFGDAYRVRMSPSLRHVVALDDRGDPIAVDLQQRAEIRGEAAAALWRESIDPARRFALVAWLREVPVPLPEIQMLQTLPTASDRQAFLHFSLVDRYRVNSGLREELPALQGQITDHGLLPGGGREDRPVATLDPGGVVRAGGMLLLGRLAWTLSTIEDKQPAIDLWDSLGGRRLFRFAPAQELLILEPLGAIVSLHWERRGDGQEVRTLRVWGLEGGL